MARGQTPTIRWNEAEQAWTSKVRFPDGHREPVKRKDKDAAQRDLDEKLARRASDVARIKNEPNAKLATFDDVVEAWLKAGCPNAGVVTASGAVRRHKTTKDENTVDQATTLLRSSITRPEVIAKVTKKDGTLADVNRKYPTTHRVKASLGPLWVDRTSTERVEEAFEAMDADGLATSTIYRTWWHLNNALAWAGKKTHRVKTNPAAEAMLPEEKPGREVKSLTLDAAEKLFARLPFEREELAPLWLTALTIGTRPGEILGIRWRWLELDADVPTFGVEERAHERKGVYKGQRDPKVKSFRTVQLHPIAVAALVKHRETLIALGKYDAEGFVFPTANMRPHSKSNARKYFKRFCREAGLGEGWTTNSLRHSFASIADEMLHERGHVSKVMGHTKQSTTDGYLHTVHTVRPVVEHAVEVWDAFLNRAAS
jgi:integrase